jgi:hypothetical protein
VDGRNSPAAREALRNAGAALVTARTERASTHAPNLAGRSVAGRRGRGPAPARRDRRRPRDVPGGGGGRREDGIDGTRSPWTCFAVEARSAQSHRSTRCTAAESRARGHTRDCAERPRSC